MPIMFNGTKEEFEKLKKYESELPDWQKRLVDEYKELKERYDKLEDFIFTENYNKLSELEKDLLSRQKDFMYSYLHTLGYRLDFYHIKKL